MYDGSRHSEDFWILLGHCQHLSTNQFWLSSIGNPDIDRYDGLVDLCRTNFWQSDWLTLSLGWSMRHNHRSVPTLSERWFFDNSPDSIDLNNVSHPESVVRKVELAHWQSYWKYSVGQNSNRYPLPQKRQPLERRCSTSKQPSRIAAQSPRWHRLK